MDGLREYIERVLVLEDCCVKCCAMAPRHLEDLVEELDETFSQSLFRLIDQKGFEDCDVYKRAFVDRRLFSKIKKDPYYHPKKKTAVAFVLALRLNLDEALDLLMRAGYTLSHSDVFDIVIEYCIVNEMYDLHVVNECLNEFDQPLLGV